MLTDDIHVFTNGLDFYRKNRALCGDRLVHSIRENKSIRFEMTPSLSPMDQAKEPAHPVSGPFEVTLPPFQSPY